jgi:hypothetical protein
MSDDVVIPFRKRPPSEAELEVYRRVTKSWPAEMRRLVFPEHFEREREQTR